MRSGALYRLLTEAAFDAELRGSLFGRAEEAAAGRGLTEDDLAYLTWLRFDTYEEIIGSAVAHWLVPVRVTERYIVVPDRYDGPVDDGVRIRLGQTFAYGNGGHPTTALCLDAVDDVVRPGDRVLDLGCGSGILSVAAAGRDAASVLAVDVDEGAVAAARHNLRRNDTGRAVAAEVGSLEEARAHGRFDVVVANILTPIVVELLGSGLADQCAPGGALVVSGVEQGEVPAAAAAMVGAGVAAPEVRGDDGWAVLVSGRPLAVRPARAAPHRAVCRAVGRAVVNAPFRHDLVHDTEAALANFALTDAERAAFSRLREADVEGVVRAFEHEVVHEGSVGCGQAPWPTPDGQGSR